jgi:hypothetical protein
MPPPNKSLVTGLQRDAASLFKLLGGDSDDRARFWEIFKGVTTPIEVRLIDQQFATAQVLVNQLTGALKELQATAKQIQG